VRAQLAVAEVDRPVSDVEQPRIAIELVRLRANLLLVACEREHRFETRVLRCRAPTS
jgi:hypothetical protein